MPVLVTSEYRCASRQKGGFNAFYVALLLLSFHWAIVLYINSSYLEKFVSTTTVGILYVVAAILTIIAFLHATPVLRRIGNFASVIVLTGIEFFAMLGMAFTTSPTVAVTLFIIHQATITLILFGLDIFMEELIGEKEGLTGGRRGFLLTVMSITGALASLGMGKLVGEDVPNFSYAYIASAFVLIPFLYIIIKYFKGFCDPEYPHLKVFKGITSFWKLPDIRNVFFAHFLLQVFFTWMVIYTPVYLSTVMGFSWDQIGSILFVGLMAYVIFEYIIGYVADTYIGEKEMMAFGFAVIAISTSWIIFLDNSSIVPWMIAMFMTRVGASFVETTTESYFFKHTNGKDTNLIGIFRITRPLSYVIGAIAGSISLLFLPYSLLFLVLGFLMIPGMFFAMKLHDTK